MEQEKFISAYESALKTKDWKIVDPLISSTAHVIFSDGSLHQGKNEVKKAFKKNFAIIKSEKYAIENIKWLKKEEQYAVYLFDFSWTGIINGKSVSGNGRGTSVIIKEDGKWKLLAEHLGKKLG